jgi:parvulin-like peptidyl-prolyl isomerase
MKKIVLGGLIAAAAFAYPGMQGGMGSNAGIVGKPMKGLTDNTVVATIDGKKVRVKDINNFLQGMTADNRIRLQDLPAQHVGQFVKQYVDTMVLYKKAKSVEKEPQFQALMKKMAVDYWLKQKLNSMKITEAEVKKFYEENKDIYFKTTPKVKARHIVVKDEKTAEKLINELKGLKGKALEKKFAELAKKYSTGPTKVNGGELGWFDPKQMVKPFAEAVNSMKPGELTLKPVKTRFGYHVILVEAKNNKNYMPLNEVKLQIIEYLKREKLQKEIQKIKDSSKVKIKIK